MINNTKYRNWIIGISVVVILGFFACAFYFRNDIVSIFYGSSPSPSLDPTIAAQNCRNLILQKSYTEALDSCEKAQNSDLKSKDFNLYLENIYHLGIINRMLGDNALKSGQDGSAFYSSAESYYQTYIKESGSTERPQTQYNLAELDFYFLNKPKDALDNLKKLVALNSFESWATLNENKNIIYNLVGRSFLFAGDYANAENYFNKAIESASASSTNSLVMYHLNLARAFVDSGNKTSGYAEVEKAKKINSKLVSVCSEANIYQAGGDFQKAISLASKDSSQHWCAYVLGISYYKLGNSSEAKKSLTNFISWIDNYKTRFNESNDVDGGYNIPAKSMFVIRAEEIARTTYNKLP